jgi:hypothetical protein
MCSAQHVSTYIVLTAYLLLTLYSPYCSWYEGQTIWTADHCAEGRVSACVPPHSRTAVPAVIRCSGPFRPLTQPASASRIQQSSQPAPAGRSHPASRAATCSASCHGRNRYRGRRAPGTAGGCGAGSPRQRGAGEQRCFPWCQDATTTSCHFCCHGCCCCFPPPAATLVHLASSRTAGALAGPGCGGSCSFGGGDGRRGRAGGHQRERAATFSAACVPNHA